MMPQKSNGTPRPVYDGVRNTVPDNTVVVGLGPEYHMVHVAHVPGTVNSFPRSRDGLKRFEDMIRNEYGKYRKTINVYLVRGMFESVDADPKGKTVESVYPNAEIAGRYDEKNDWFVYNGKAMLVIDQLTVEKEK